MPRRTMRAQHPVLRASFRSRRDSGWELHAAADGQPAGRRDAAVCEPACAEVTRRQTQHRRTGAPTAAMIRRSCAIVLAIALHGVPAAAQAPLPPVAPQVACASLRRFDPQQTPRWHTPRELY